MPLASLLRSKLVHTPVPVWQPSNSGRATRRCQVHAYIQAPQSRTAYLSELCSGSEVLVADAAGRMRTAVVGRIKIESRPLVSVLNSCTTCTR